MGQRLLGGRYEIGETIGRGGMATVWRGRDLRLDRPVAIKTLGGTAPAEPGMMQRFEREARTVARLAHPNIVSVYDFGDEDGAAYLVMELVEGESLAAMIARGPLDVPRALAIAAQTCDALAAAHEAGVVHRDVKPGNILVTPGGVVKICDFGIARLQRAAASQASLTGPAVVLGTSEFMAPEQASGGPVDARADLYALGCVLYAMLTGRPPFVGDTPLSVLSQHLHRVPEPLAARRPGVPAALDALVAELLAKRPDDRPRDARQVRARLAAISGPAATLPITAPWPTAAASDSPVPGQPRRQPARGAAAVVPPTRTLPLDPADAGVPVPAGGRRRLRVGPAGLAAVAVVAALVTAIAVTFLPSGGEPGSQARGAPAGGPTPAATAPADVADPSATDDPRSLGDRLRELWGKLDGDAANEVRKKLDDVLKRLDRGQTDKAAEKLADLREKLSELREQGKIGDRAYEEFNRAYEELKRRLDELADRLPQNGRGG